MCLDMRTEWKLILKGTRAGVPGILTSDQYLSSYAEIHTDDKQ